MTKKCKRGLHNIVKLGMCMECRREWIRAYRKHRWDTDPKFRKAVLAANKKYLAKLSTAKGG